MTATSNSSTMPPSAGSAHNGGIVHLLSGGAANGLVQAMESLLLSSEGIQVQGQFGAVGAMKAALLDGAPCDVAILTAQLISDLQKSGHLIAGSEKILGEVETGVAVLQGEKTPDASTEATLRESLLNATAIYFPDPARATAGIHFASVLDKLGIGDSVRARLKPFPNGLTAMHAMVRDARAGAIGCTQVTEIRYTPGVAYVGGLPPGYELKTVYSAAISRSSQRPELAERFISVLTGEQASGDRRRLGFD